MAAMSRHHHDPLLVLSSLLSSLPRQRSNEPTRPLPSRVVQKQKPTRRSAMAGEGGGRLPLDLSLATAGPSAGERRPRARPNRRTLSSLYAELGAMLPNLPIDRPASKEEIVDAAAARVKVLEDTVAVLETYHSVRSPLHGAGAGAGAAAARRPEVSVAVGAVCFCARLPARSPGSLTRVLEAFHRRGVEVLVATVGPHGHGGAAVVTVTAAAAPPEVLQMIRADITGIC
ncbi:uncharacterized protein [Zea mays]|uniref:BHLH domain-containing protein n=1 Tax=Zea mays TaxID=4577 RepID=A0A804RG35_MAIZE|nr:uncharacterized protein LOC100276871 [Zea mays]|eukprot:XP_020400581.1 uncharacterized protein LOC100276871 isoform X1 [Zea mays]